MPRSDNVSYDEAILFAAHLVVYTPNARKHLVGATIAALFQETVGVVRHDLTIEINYLKETV